MMTLSDTSPTLFFGSLPIARYRLEISLSKPIDQSTYMGSAWRGLIGWELQRLICPFEKRPGCKSCFILEHCPYFRLFENQSLISGIREMPRGYIFSPSEGMDQTLQHLDVTLMGDCIRYFPAILKAIHSGKQVGLGPSRITYHVASVCIILPGETLQTAPVDPDDLIGMNTAFSLSDWLAAAPGVLGAAAFAFITPVRIRKRGKYMGNMVWPYFFVAIARRLEALNCLFSGGDLLGKERYEAIADAFSGITTIQDHLSWLDYSRYSSRQRQKVPMGGLVGTAVFEASEAWLLPWLQAASLVHVGKGASMGLGNVLVEAGSPKYILGAPILST